MGCQIVYKTLDPAKKRRQSCIKYKDRDWIVVSDRIFLMAGFLFVS